MNPAEIRETAYHEAAHAAAAYFLGVGVKCIAVNPNLGDGWVTHSPCDNEESSVIAIAGMMGAKLMGCEGFAASMSASDHKGFVIPAGEDTNAYIDRIINRTAGLLNRNRRDVALLAERIVERRNMTGHEVYELLAKTPTHRKRLTATIGITDEDRRTVVATINTADVDRDSEVVLPSGMNADNFLLNPVLLWMHNHNELPVGKCIAIDATDERIIAKFRFADRPDKYPAGKEWQPDTLLSLYRQRVLNSFSIGFIPITTRAATDDDRRTYGDCRRVIEDWQLLEVSCVTLPANPAANSIATSEKRQRTAVVPKRVVHHIFSDDTPRPVLPSRYVLII
jgi:hypothetical protein